MLLRLNQSEKKILRKIKTSLSKIHEVYQFWFVYDDNMIAINWEGGSGLSMDIQFRNQFTLHEDNRLTKNW